MWVGHVRHRKTRNLTPNVRIAELLKGGGGRGASILSRDVNKQRELTSSYFAVGFNTSNLSGVREVAQRSYKSNL